MQRIVNEDLEIYRAQARQRDTEVRRARGLISCAECRRLKLKCDKKVPCSSCRRRGCQTICPNGVLSAGQGTRYVLADTEKLHHRIARMSSRIQKLEDALRVAHAYRTNSPHPLLSRELLNIKTGAECNKENSGELPEESDSVGRSEDADLADALGTLSISEKGQVRFLGAGGTSERLLLNESVAREDTSEETSPIASTSTSYLSCASRAFPFTPLYSTIHEIETNLRLLLESHLPTRERASALCEAYLENLSWFFRPVDRTELIEEIIPSFYPRDTSPLPSSANSAARTDAHDLALLFMAFASGAAGDLTLPFNNDEAEQYVRLGQAALSLKPILESEGTSLAAVQAICMMGVHNLFTGRKMTQESAWKTQEFGCSLAATIGLHRDPGRWKLQHKETQRRRRVFWEIVSIDQLKSLSSGRPPIFSSRNIDCEFPEDEEATVHEDGTIIPSHWHWFFEFTRLLLTVTEKFCTAAPLKYKEILDLDKRIRESLIQHGREEPRSCPFGKETLAAEVRWRASRMFVDILFIFLHRSFFAQAITCNPANPSQSPFAYSFLSAYRSSASLLKTLRECFDELAPLLLRIWPVWSHALAAAVVIGSVVTRVPWAPFAPSAYQELELVILLFEKATVHPVVKQGLPVLLRFRDKARDTYYQQQIATGLAASAIFNRSPNASANSTSTQKVVGDNDELNVLAGTTRLVSKKSPSVPSSSSGRGSTVSPRNSSNSPSAPPAPPVEVAQVFHPADSSHIHTCSSESGGMTHAGAPPQADTPDSDHLRAVPSFSAHSSPGAYDWTAVASSRAVHMGLYDAPDLLPEYNVVESIFPSWDLEADFSFPPSTAAHPHTSATSASDTSGAMDSTSTFPYVDFDQFNPGALGIDDAAWEAFVQNSGLGFPGGVYAPEGSQWH